MTLQKWDRTRARVCQHTAVAGTLHTFASCCFLAALAQASSGVFPPAITCKGAASCDRAETVAMLPRGETVFPSWSILTHPLHSHSWQEETSQHGQDKEMRCTPMGCHSALQQTRGRIRSQLGPQ